MAPKPTHLTSPPEEPRDHLLQGAVSSRHYQHVGLLHQLQQLLSLAFVVRLEETGEGMLLFNTVNNCNGTKDTLDRQDTNKARK